MGSFIVNNAFLLKVVVLSISVGFSLIAIVRKKKFCSSVCMLPFSISALLAITGLMYHLESDATSRIPTLDMIGLIVTGLFATVLLSVVDIILFSIDQKTATDES